MPKQFKKGDPRINRTGRKKGQPNKSTNELREFLMTFIDENREQLQTDYNSLDVKDRLTFFDKMLKHCLPAPQDELMRLSDEDLNRIIEKLKSEKLRIA